MDPGAGAGWVAAAAAGVRTGGLLHARPGRWRRRGYRREVCTAWWPRRLPTTLGAAPHPGQGLFRTRFLKVSANTGHSSDVALIPGLGPATGGRISRSGAASYHRLTCRDRFGIEFRCRGHGAGRHPRARRRLVRSGVLRRDLWIANLRAAGEATVTQPGGRGVPVQAIELSPRRRDSLRAQQDVGGRRPIDGAEHVGQAVRLR